MDVRLFLGAADSGFAGPAEGIHLRETTLVAPMKRRRQKKVRDTRQYDLFSLNAGRLDQQRYAERAPDPPPRNVEADILHTLAAVVKARWSAQTSPGAEESHSS